MFAFVSLSGGVVHAVKSEPGSQRGGGSVPRHAPGGGGRGHGGGEGGALTVTVKASALSKAPTGKGSSKFRGVSWHKDNMKWRATIFKGLYLFLMLTITMIVVNACWSGSGPRWVCTVAINYF